MTCMENLNEISHSRNVRIFVVVLIVFVCLLGVVINWPSAAVESSLKVIPEPVEGVIEYKSSSPQSVDAMVAKISKGLEPYTLRLANPYNCDFNRPAPPGSTCDLDLRDFGPCSKENFYSYNRASPCVFLKLSKKPDWIPEFYNDSFLRAEMPPDLKENIRVTVGRNKHEEQMIWVSCRGKVAGDIDNIGPINYLPRRGFPGYFFPCTNDEGCTEPLIAIHFERPMRGVVIEVECRVWAMNLDDKIEFNLLID